MRIVKERILVTGNEGAVRVIAYSLTYEILNNREIIGGEESAIVSVSEMSMMRIK